MSASQSEPRNPFYLLLLIASFLFVITVLAVALVPVLEDKARQAGADVPVSPFRQALRSEGWRWLLYEVGAVIVFGLLSMGLDRLRRLKSESAADTMVRSDQSSLPPDQPTGKP
jgi:hypothetical protein